MADTGKPTVQQLSHAERERERQDALKRCRILNLAELRIVRAELADLLETDVPPTMRERATIRGEVIHALIKAYEAGTATAGQRGGGLWVRFSVSPEQAKRALLMFPERQAPRR